MALSLSVPTSKMQSAHSHTHTHTHSTEHVTSNDKVPDMRYDTMQCLLNCECKYVPLPSTAPAFCGTKLLYVDVCIQHSNLLLLLLDLV